ncbi:MAG TPA: hypothetical protein VFS38_01990, partial [Actinomycetota bacterium]|nr:hypothetical protein [Actinomycetota bacterium]
MSLQQRLTLLFVAIVMLPITVAGFWARDSVVSEVRQREAGRLSPALIEVESAIATRLQAVDEFARPTSARLSRNPNPERLHPLLQRRLAATDALDFLI